MAAKSIQSNPRDYVLWEVKLDDQPLALQSINLLLQLKKNNNKIKNCTIGVTEEIKVDTFKIELEILMKRIA